MEAVSYAMLAFLVRNPAGLFEKYIKVSNAAIIQ